MNPGLACALVMLVFVRHDSAFALAPFLGLTPSASFYLLGAMWEAFVASIVLWMLWPTVRTFWRDLAIYAMAVDLVESLQIAGCKVALAGSAPPFGVTSCDFVTGMPIYFATLVLEGLALACLLGIWWFREPRDTPG